MACSRRVTNSTLSSEPSPRSRSRESPKPIPADDEPGLNSVTSCPTSSSTRGSSSAWLSSLMLGRDIGAGLSPHSYRILIVVHGVSQEPSFWIDRVLGGWRPVFNDDPVQHHSRGVFIWSGHNALVIPNCGAGRVPHNESATLLLLHADRHYNYRYSRYITVCPSAAS